MLHHIRPFHHPLRHTAGACSVVAGILHATVVAVIHFTPFPPLETLFFVDVGLLQILIGFFFFYRPLLSVYRLGLLINGGMAVLYIFLRFLPVPFMGVPEGFDALGIIVLVTEAITVKSSLAWLLTHNEHGENTNFFIATTSACAVMLIGALGFYSSSMGMVMVFPERSVIHSHGHSDIEHHEEVHTKEIEQHEKDDHHNDTQH